MQDTPDSPENINRSPSISPPPEVVRTHLERVLGSRIFRSAHSQTRFLRYVVDQTLVGRGNQIKEYMIGTEAFGRDESFDPRLDPIVRTQARKLRARLETYYAAEGLREQVRIEFRKGSYEPAFQWAGPQIPADADSPEDPPVVTDDGGVVPGVSEPAHIFPVSSRWLWVMVATALALTVGVYLFKARLQTAEPPIIAVLPFLNLGEPADDFLSDGLSEELINSLKQVPGLRVANRASSFEFKGKSADFREAGSRLHARAILTGSVRKVGERLRITAQLDSAPGGYHLWNGTFDRSPSEVKTIPEEITLAVVNLIVDASKPEMEQALAKSFPNRRLPNSRAYQSYLRGLYFWNKLSAGGLNTAIQYFQEAIAEDPAFARAYVGLADCYVIAPQVGSVPTPDALAKIKAVASRALELDDRLGGAHFDLAVAAEYEFNWNLAEVEFRKGLALSPDSAVGHLWYAKFLAIRGRKDEVFVHRKIAAERDPISPYAVQALAGYFSVMGRYDEAVTQFKSALALDPNFGLAHQGLGVAYLFQGKQDEAIEELELANKWMIGPRRMALFGYALARSGRTIQAHKILGEFLAKEKDGSVPAVAIALVYLGLRDNDQAFRWLEKAIDQRDLDVTLLWDTPFEPLRPDPRFTKLLRRMKLG